MKKSLGRSLAAIMLAFGVAVVPAGWANAEPVETPTTVIEPPPADTGGEVPEAVEPEPSTVPTEVIVPAPPGEVPAPQPEPTQVVVEPAPPAEVPPPVVEQPSVEAPPPPVVQAPPSEETIPSSVEEVPEPEPSQPVEESPEVIVPEVPNDESSTQQVEVAPEPSERRKMPSSVPNPELEDVIVPPPASEEQSVPVEVVPPSEAGAQAIPDATRIVERPVVETPQQKRVQIGSKQVEAQVVAPPVPPIIPEQVLAEKPVVVKVERVNEWDGDKGNKDREDHGGPRDDNGHGKPPWDNNGRDDHDDRDNHGRPPTPGRDHPDNPWGNHDDDHDDHGKPDKPGKPGNHHDDDKDDHDDHGKCGKDRDKDHCRPPSKPPVVIDHDEKNNVVINQSYTKVINQIINNYTTINNTTIVKPVSYVYLKNWETHDVFRFQANLDGRFILPQGWCGGAGGYWSVSGGIQVPGFSAYGNAGGFHTSGPGCGYVPPPPLPPAYPNQLVVAPPPGYAGPPVNLGNYYVPRQGCNCVYSPPYNTYFNGGFRGNVFVPTSYSSEQVFKQGPTPGAPTWLNFHAGKTPWMLIYGVAVAFGMAVLVSVFVWLNGRRDGEASA